VDELDGVTGPTPAQAHARDVLDAYEELGIDVTPLLPAPVERWYRRS
jgi:predicted ATPase